MTAAFTQFQTMTLEQSLKALKSAFTSKASEAESFAKELSAAKAKNDTLAAELEGLKEVAANAAGFVAERDAAIAKVAELTKALAEANAVKAQAVSQIESVGKVAAKIAASVGVAPAEISPADAVAESSKSDEEIWTEYCGIKDSAQKVAFYNKNRARILAHVGIK